MREKITVHVEAVDDAVWAFVTPSLGQFPDTPLDEALRWILEQINFGNFRIEPDSRQRNVSLVLGLAAAPSSMDTTVDLQRDQTRRRLMSLDIAGFFATFREQGIEPEGKDLFDKVSASVTDAGHFNTDLYYAFAMVDILKRIRAKSFVFSAPPISGKATADVVRLLGEATRSYLVGFNRASVALCRACVEGY